jgi:hypothetical protein
MGEVNALRPVYELKVAGIPVKLQQKVYGSMPSLQVRALLGLV